jgi:purine-binding chemotaxis protein CheW
MVLDSVQDAVQAGTAVNSSGSSTVQVVEFLLGKEHFAIDLFDVKEVVEYTRITRLPNAPTYIRGIIDLRGEITTIIDLKEQLKIRGGAEEIQEENSRIIVLDEAITSHKTGIMVDDVLSVSTFMRNQVDTSPASINRGESHVIGIIRKSTRIKDKDVTELVIWIDIREILGEVASVDVPGSLGSGQG